MTKPQCHHSKLVILLSDTLCAKLIRLPKMYVHFVVVLNVQAMSLTLAIFKAAFDCIMLGCSRTICKHFVKIDLSTHA